MRRGKLFAPRRPARPAAPAAVRGRAVAAAGLRGLREVLHPLITIARGLLRMALAVHRRWRRTPADRRGSAVLLAGLAVLAVALLPHGPTLAAAALATTAAWFGRRPARRRSPDRPHERPGKHGTGDRPAPAREPAPARRLLPRLDAPDDGRDGRSARLRSLHEALLPFFALPHDPDPQPLYGYDGVWQRAVEQAEFTEDGRIRLLRLRCPSWFPSADHRRRLPVERLLAARCGPDREYRFDWQPERALLEVCALGPLPGGIHAQRFVTGPGEIVLGFTDPGALARTLPVTRAGLACDAPPVLWRTGGAPRQPHLLAAGTQGSGTSTLLRSVALQALEYAEVVLVDGAGTGEFDCFAGCAGVLRTESTASGVASALEWAAAETERRLLAAVRARRAGAPVPEEVRRPLWLMVDRPAACAGYEYGAACDPWRLLETPLRHGRAARVTVAAAEHAAALPAPAPAAYAHRPAHPLWTAACTRVVLGAPPADRCAALLGEAAPVPPAAELPPGRGWARLGDGAVLRLQVPATPDPYDETAGARERDAVRGLLAERAAAGAAPVPGAGRPADAAPGDAAAGARLTRQPN